MTVLIEAVSFIARRDRLDECWPMASEGFIADAPSGSVCADVGYTLRSIGVHRLGSRGMLHPRLIPWWSPW